MITLDNAVKAKPEETGTTPAASYSDDDDDSPAERALSVMLRDVFGRAVQRETKALREIFGKEPSKIEGGIRKFYVIQESTIARDLVAIAECAKELLGVTISVSVEASRIAGESRSALLGLLASSHGPDAMTDLLAAWDEHRANNLASEMMEKWKHARQ